jgi:putative transposase
MDVRNRRFTEEQIMSFLKEAEGGVPVKELARKHGFSDTSFYLWRGKFGGGMDLSAAKRLESLRAENARLKKLLAESMLENEAAREALRRKF